MKVVKILKICRNSNNAARNDNETLTSDWQKAKILKICPNNALKKAIETLQSTKIVDEKMPPGIRSTIER